MCINCKISYKYKRDPSEFYINVEINDGEKK